MKTTAFISGLLIVLLILLAGQTGCSLTQTQSEHQHTYDTIVHHDLYTIPDDIDMLLMMDRPTRLSRWIVSY